MEEIGRKKQEKIEYKIETKKLIKEAKQKYIDNLSKKITDPNCRQKVFWSSYKRLLNNKKNTNIPPIFDNGTLVSNFKKKAEIFNQYFAKQCTPLENDSILPPMVDFMTENRLSTFVICVQPRCQGL